jgi:hypothetical protein
MNNEIKLKGDVSIQVIRNNEEIYNQYIPNNIMTVGLSTIVGLVGSGLTTPNKFEWMSIGLGSSTLSGNQVQLGSEAYKIAGSVYQVTTTNTNDTLSFSGLYLIDATKTINEAGIFNGSGVNIGSMLARTCFASTAAISGDALYLNWNIKFS